MNLRDRRLDESKSVRIPYLWARCAQMITGAHHHRRAARFVFKLEMRKEFQI
jgi:hypothetical protein